MRSLFPTTLRALQMINRRLSHLPFSSVLLVPRSTMSGYWTDERGHALDRAGNIYQPLSTCRPGSYPTERSLESEQLSPSSYDSFIPTLLLPCACAPWPLSDIKYKD